jgi:hypothetical protein
MNAVSQRLLFQVGAVRVPRYDVDSVNLIASQRLLSQMNTGMCYLGNTATARSLKIRNLD